MADEEDFTIPIEADVSDAVGSLQELGDAAEQLGDSLESAGERGSEALEGIGEKAEEAGESGEGFGELAEGVNKAAEEFLGLQNVLGTVLGAAGLGALAEVFDKAVEATIELGTQTRNTAALLDVSASDARAFNETMASMGVNSRAATMAIRQLEMDATTGGKRLSTIGESAKDANGHIKDGITLFTEVAEKIASIANPGDRAAAAITLLGRAGTQILPVLDQLNEKLEENRKEQGENTELDEQAVKGANQLRESLTQLKAAWEDSLVSLAPEIESVLKTIASAMKELAGDIKDVANQLNALLHMDFGPLQRELEETGDDLTRHMFTKTTVPQLGGPSTPEDMFESGTYAGSGQGGATGNLFGDQSDQVKQDGIQAGKNWADGVNEGFEATEAKVREKMDGFFDPSKLKSGGKGKGAGGDQWASLEEAADLSDEKMQKLNAEFQRMGSESDMAAKEGGQSYQQLAATATAAYADMQQKYKVFLDEVQNGTKQAAMAAERDWRQAAQEFQQDWSQAAAKAKQDMEGVKKTADQISSDVSGILNSAISGKLNWAQEFDKILERMLSSLIKHLTEQIAMWIAHEAQVNSIKATGGATGLAIQKTQNVAAGTSDAITAAKGAYSSAAQVPYIGWIIAPFAAAAAFAGVEAFGSAAQGFDIPAGMNPITQLHAKEMVLPADLAQGVRNMTSSGGGQSGGNRTTHNWNLTALDSKSVADMLRGNPDVIAGIIADNERSGSRMYTG